MTAPTLVDPSPDDVPIHILNPDMVETWRAHALPAHAAFAAAQGFAGGLGQRVLLPSETGAIAAVLIGWGTPLARARDRFHLAAHTPSLPALTYALATTPDGFDPEIAALGWLQSQMSYSLHAGSEEPRPEPRLATPSGVAATRLNAIAAGVALTQTLINTPANLLGPEALEQAVRHLAQAHGAECTVVTGEDLLARNFPMIHAVGRAAAEAPRLLDMTWGDPAAPRLTLVGKGVCFDTGGLNLKPGASMGLMKKDMGGAANAIGLASMIMSLGLPLRLRLLIPAVENAVSAGAFRPGDILTSRKGLTVEVNNTDAEGRLVLADALALADEESPDLLLCMATLTGAARVALGPDLPPVFTDDDKLAADLATAGRIVADPLWRMPFWDPYEPMIEPGIADLDNAPKGGHAGAITAALFLRRFVEQAGSFAHIDLFGWTPTTKPGRPKGGAAQAIRAVLHVLETRYPPTR